jgi:ornithine cyclodeaminase
MVLAAVQVLDDTDVRRWLTAPVAVAAARTALADAYRGALTAPPRVAAPAGPVSLVFTAGGYQPGPAGFRVYGTWPGESDQAVLVWGPGGRLSTVIVGSEFGDRRTGALGGAAADLLARADASVAAVIGTGRQAWTQLWALAAVRKLRDVRVYSRRPEARAAFAGRARATLGVFARPADSAAGAVSGADLVVLATRATSPVIDPVWVGPGTHVTTVGPKTVTAHETPPELAAAAALVCTDSPAQAAAYGEPFFTDRPLTHLGAIAAGEAAGRGSEAEITLFCSTGLAGSEVVIAEALVREHRDHHAGTGQAVR